MESETKARGTGWAKVLRISAIELVALMTVVMGALIQGIDPALLVFALAFLVGLVLFTIRGRSGVIMLLIVGMIFVLANLPFALPTLFALNSPFEFILNLLFLLGGFGTIIGAVNLVRGNEGVGSPGPGRWLLLSTAAVVLLSAVSIVVKLTDEQATARPNDIRLIAEDTEFSNTHIVTNNERVSVFVENKDIFSHTFEIEELDVHLDLPGSSKKRIDFDAPLGEYEFRCTIPGHDDMRGTLVVSEV
ncbi:MAG: hypothetical protein QOK47_698 [Actinomycetota bacterium]|nr:hypothetical protein [Actinomycetota bacterium]